MKKKGLIISTAVMVVVLIAALTTGTFAWFSSTTSAKIDTITMEATSAAELEIGVNKIANKMNYPNSDSEFFSGDIRYSTSEWAGGGNFGPLITFDTNLKFNAGAAVGIAQEAFQGKESAQIKQYDFYKGMAQGNTADLDRTSAEAAKSPDDYLDVVIGVMPAAGKSVNQAFLHITVEATAPDKIGMAAAIHFAIRVKNSKTGSEDKETLIDPTTMKPYEEETQLGKNESGTILGVIDAFAGLKNADSWSGETTTYGKYTKAADGQAAKWELWIEILPYQATAYSTLYSDRTTNGNVALVGITAWLDGDDDSCVTTNSGTGGNISFEFINSTSNKTLTKGVLSEG